METRVGNNNNEKNNGNGNYNGNSNDNCNQNGNGNGNENGNFKHNDNVNSNLNGSGNGNSNRNGTGNGNRNFNGNGNSNVNVNVNGNGQTIQRHDTPNPAGTAYWWTHGKTGNDQRNSGLCRYPDIGHKRTFTLDIPQDGRTFGKERQGGSDMLVKTQTKNNIILQHTIISPPSSHNAIVHTGATNFFVMTKTP